MKTSNDSGELFKALAKAQAELEAVRKDSRANAGKYSYTYADLASCWAAARDALAEHGLSVHQETTDLFRLADFGSGELLSAIANGPQNRIYTITRIAHGESGQWLETMGLPLSIGNLSDPQDVGKAITYARRYALLAVLGMATEDDDAASAHRSAHSRQQSRNQPPRARPSPPGADEDVMGQWLSRIESCQNAQQLQGVGHAIHRDAALTAEQKESLKASYAATMAIVGSQEVASTPSE